MLSKSLLFELLDDEPWLYEQLAEECCELAHAALKRARILRGENPTPETLVGNKQAFTEESVDVYICMQCLYENIDHDLWEKIYKEKINRFEKRLKDAQKVSDR